jgi:hypothetical protein
MVLSVDGLSFSGLTWMFKLLPRKHSGPTRCVSGHLLVNFRDQHMFL